MTLPATSVLSVPTESTSTRGQIIFKGMLDRATQPRRWHPLTPGYRHVRVHHVDKEKDDPSLREVLAQRPEGGNRGRRRRMAQ